MVVDDDPTNLIVAKGILRKQGYTVCIAKGGQEALDQLDEVRPSAFILDYMMPDLDGPGLLRRIREMPEHRSTPVLMLTASADSEHIREGFGAGAQDFITRPVDWRVLSARVAAAIELHEARKVAREAEQRHEAMLSELYEARNVQHAELPTKLEEWPGWRGTGAVVPSGSIGGDLFSFIHREEQSSVVAIVDVSGHGVAAALVASRVMATLRSALIGRGPGEALEVLNERLQSTSGKYAVVVLIETHDDHVLVVNAGLPPVALIRNGEIIDQVRGCGIPPGMLPDQTYHATRLSIADGDRLVVMSDGLTEPFGHADDVGGCAESMALMDRDCFHDWSTEEVENRIHARLSRGQPDDATLVVVERVGPEAAALVEQTFDASVSEIEKAVAWTMQRLPGDVDETMVNLGLTEAITNAVVHGTLGLGDVPREELLTQLMSTSMSAPQSLRVAVSARGTESTIHIRWLGHPCPVDKRSPPESLDPLQETGRGLYIMHSVFADISWDDDGKGVRLLCPSNAAT